MSWKNELTEAGPAPHEDELTEAGLASCTVPPGHELTETGPVVEPAAAQQCHGPFLTVPVRALLAQVLYAGLGHRAEMDGHPLAAAAAL